MWTEAKRDFFQTAMCATNTLIVTDPTKGLVLIPIRKLGNVLSKNIPNFDPKWNSFLQPDQNSRSRCHKHLERADIDKDIIYMKHLLAGKTKLDETVDQNQIEFLHFYIKHSKVCWNHICNRQGCVKVATKSCGKCKVAKYCSRECQSIDWRQSHKHACESLIDWVPHTSQTCESIIG